MDEWYLCICDKNHSRAECFGYDHNLDRCSECLNDGQCLKKINFHQNFYAYVHNVTMEVCVSLVLKVSVLHLIHLLIKLIVLFE